MKPANDARARRERLLQRLHLCLDHGDRSSASKLLEQLQQGPWDAEAAFARWRWLSQDETLGPALSAVQEAVAAFPERPELRHALGWTLTELGRPEDAVTELEEACRLDPDAADHWHSLAVTREVLGRDRAMQAAFMRVYALDTAEPRDPHRFSTDQILAWADRAVRMLPDEVVEAVKILPIFVQDYPDDWILEEPPYDPRLLGLFDGPTFAQWEAIDSPQSTPHVYLFQRNLERLCPDPRVMAEQVRVTVHHEIGHFLGLDEHDLVQRGLG